MGAHQEEKASKSLYYNILEKDLKKSYDEIKNSKFNIEFSLKMNQFISTNKRRIINIVEGSIDWKSYLLNKLNSNDENSWELPLFNYVYSEFEQKKLEKKYFFEDEIFFNQFFLRNNPQIALNESSKELNQPILSLLYDMDELDEYSSNSKNKSKKSKSKKKNKTKKDRNTSQISDEIEMSRMSLNDSKMIERGSINDDDNDDGIIQINEFNDNGRRLTSSKITDSEKSFLNKNLKEGRNMNKYFSYQIRKHINLIRGQLDKKEEHPIYNIIIKFSEIYSNKINRYYNSFLEEEEDEKKIEEAKNIIIKDIQNFIDIIGIALKLFYMKSINYDFFINERDEFINLICYFLFNEKKFEQNLFKFFKLSNTSMQEKFDEKKETILKDITPGEIGIKTKFRLNEDTEELKEKIINKEEDIEEPEKKNKDTGFIKYIKKIDNEKEQERNNSIIESVHNLEMVSSFNSSRKMNLFKPEESQSFKFKDKDKNDNIMYSQKNKKNIIERDIVSSYGDFSEKYNSLTVKTKLKEVYDEDADNNPSEIAYPISEMSKYDPNKPYQEAIDYINTIKDYKAPLDKLTIIALVSPLITDNINNCWNDFKGLKENYLSIDADELLNIYLYIICKMNADSIITQLDLIKHFTGTVSKQSMIGYFYTTVDGCVKYIMSLKDKSELIQK